jgi:hypothetical protein
MNTRLFYALLAVQALFALGLIVVGLRSRDERRLEYLELTHRITSGHAKPEDFMKLSSLITHEADETVVRTLFGPPLRRATEIEVVEKDSDSSAQHRKGNFWIYYPVGAQDRALDFDALSKLQGPVQCFVVEFDAKGRARGDMISVMHPLP